jgi:exopolysaccharide biosynthesis polyprenyl glycosylphosphotransferase
VVIASSGLSFEAFETLVHRCFEAGAAVSIAPSTLHRINPRFELTKTRIGAVLRLRPGGVGLPRLAIKRAMDVALSIVGLILLAPLLFAIALVIKLDTPGPAVFRQLRTGVGGRSFWMYKFRTMIDDAEQIKPQLHHLNESGDPRLFKIRNDPRVTRVGRFLRRTSLDELPQLLNVLAGEMSVIGPRPFFPEDLDQYAEHHFERLSVLPGITGLWQVSGRSSVLDFEEVVRLDQHYIHHWSVWMDLRILALTLPAVLRRDGAY